MTQRKDAVMYMKKLDELIASNTKLAELLGKKVVPQKKTHPVVWILAILGAVAAIAAIAYGVYRYLNPEYFEDFDYDDEILDEEFEDESEDITENAKVESEEEISEE